MTSTDAHLSIDINLPAPQFSLIDIFDRQIDLSEYRGKSILIAFFRHAGCPFCNTRVHALMGKYEELKQKGLEMIFFFESEKALLLKSHFHKTISPIPLISDPEKIWYDSYGVESSAAKSAKGHITGFFQSVIAAKKRNLPVHWMAGNESIKTIPAEFLIDRNGIVRKMYYSKGLRDRMPMETILEFVKY